MKKVFIILTALIIIGCAEPPLELLNEAETTVQYSNEYATKQLELAKKEIEYQNQKFALFRNYDIAISMLNKSLDLSEGSFIDGSELIVQRHNDYNYQSPILQEKIIVKLDEQQFNRLIQALERK